MAGFYRKHIPNFAKHATPLTNLTRKREQFAWTKHCQTAFETLNDCLAKAPVLARAQNNQPSMSATT